MNGFGVSLIYARRYFGQNACPLLPRLAVFLYALAIFLLGWLTGGAGGERAGAGWSASFTGG